MNKHRTLLAGVAALAVTGGLATVVTAPATAAPDPAPTGEGSTWLASQLTDGLIHNPNFGGFDDYGLTVDAGLALAEVGDTATVDTISAALAPVVTSYYTYYVTAEKTHVSAGSLAKAAAFAQVAGDDASAYGGQDLVAQLEDRVSTDVASAGRIGDVFFPEEQFEADYVNTIGQAFAAKALDVEGSTLTDSVTDYLLAQQCAAGFFRLDLGATAAATCDAATPAASPSTDVTALAVLNLLGQTDDTDVDARVDAAVAWLVGTQNPDGSFGSDAQIATANANSTGLAAWALGEVGETAAAEKAAVWLRAHQVANTASCTPYAAADDGAVAYDDTAISAVVATPISDDTSDQFRRATAQALPGLRYAPDGVTSEVASDSAFVKAGTTIGVPVSGSPGDVVCLSGPGNTKVKRFPVSGETTIGVTLPAGTAVRTYTVEDSSEALGTVTFRALGATKLAVQVGKVAPRRSKQNVVVTGLERREQVKLFFNGKQVATGSAGPQGAFKRVVTVPAGTPLGQRRIRAVGEFGTRAGATTVKVTPAR